jgi:hypothetical protein
VHEEARDKPSTSLNTGRSLPSDRGSRAILGDQDLLHVRKDETRSGLNLVVDVEQERRNRNCRHDFVAAEIVPPAERRLPSKPWNWNSLKARSAI